VVNNAGYAFVCPFEDLSMDEINAQFDTNFYGSVSYAGCIAYHVKPKV
jgi:NAD(P)-dependent dehydrogenase (short-subunit alcohol dehydrogenase family)